MPAMHFTGKRKKIFEVQRGSITYLRNTATKLQFWNLNTKDLTLRLRSVAWSFMIHILAEPLGVTSYWQLFSLNEYLLPQQLMPLRKLGVLQLILTTFQN